MRKQLVAITLAAVACGLAFSQGPGGSGSAEERLAALEREAAASSARQTVQARELAQLRTQLDETLRYLEAQSLACGQLAETLDASEKAGFTYGINPESRHILLRGWREQLSSARRGLPARTPAAPVAPAQGSSAKR